MSHKIKIYSDKSYLPTETAHVIMVYPFWGINPDSLESYPSAYEKYTQIGSEFFEMTSYEDADYIVAPVAWEKNEAGRELILQMAQLATPQKPIIVFYLHDSTDLLPIPNSLIFRTSLYQSKQHPHEFSLPSWRNDLLKLHHGGQVVIRQKQDKPVIGFCGYVITTQMNLLQYAKDILRYLKDGISKTQKKRQQRTYHVLRWKILQKLNKGTRIKTNFIIRHQFYGRYKNTQRTIYDDEYFQNMIESDYILCVRGAGNFSYRLYETLCYGRIPIFINTDCVLPYDFAVDWKRYCVWVEEKDIHQIEQKILEFHQNLSPQEFIDLQYQCRQFWEDYLSPHGFFREFYRHLKQVRGASSHES